MPEDDERTVEASGRHVRVSTGFFEVQVNGDPDDSLADVQETAFDIVDKTMDDVQELDDRLDDGDDLHYS
jgi:hypothetical protein